MENKNKERYITTDLHTQSFLRTMLPNSFIGINKNESGKVNFVFSKEKETDKLLQGYFSGKKYLISPQTFANYMDLGKDLIFGNI